MKILVSSDWHLDARTAGVERLPELDAYVAAICRRLDEQRFDAFIHAGDYFDPGSLSECRWSAKLFSYVSEIHSMVGESIWITGNHDVVESAENWSVLSPLLVAAASGWTGTTSRLQESCPVICYDGPRIVDVGETVVLALPFLSRAAARSQDTADRLKMVTNVARTRSSGRKLVVVGHFSIPGIVPGSEEEMQRGHEQTFPAELIASLKPDLVINGHYHARQTVKVGGVTVEIPGAPLRMSFGEKDDGPRGWLEIDL